MYTHKREFCRYNLPQGGLETSQARGTRYAHPSRCMCVCMCMYVCVCVCVDLISNKEAQRQEAYPKVDWECLTPGEHGMLIPLGVCVYVCLCVCVCVCVCIVCVYASMCVCVYTQRREYS